MPLRALSLAVLLGTVATACDRSEGPDVNPLEGLPPPGGHARVSPQTAADERKLIRNGSIRLEVDELRATMAAASRLALDVDGFVAGSELREGPEGSRTASLVLRVPADSLQRVMDAVAELGRVVSVSVNARDVSREYFDLDTRMAVKEETVRRLQALMSRSGDLEDLLAVERELGRVTEELESLKGRIRYYDRRIALSELRVDLAQPGAAIAPGAFRPVGAAIRGAVDVFARSLAALVYVVVFLIPWLLLAGLLWPLGRRAWAARKRGGESEGPGVPRSEET